MARLRRERIMPVAGGENLGNVLDFRRAVEAEALDVVQPSLAKMGGISAVVQAVAQVKRSGARVVLHSPFSGPALIAAVHVIAAGGPELLCEHRYGTLAARPLGDWTEAQDGTLRVPDGPGLGFEIDPDVVARYRVA
jgi:L-alanine-DL-glutamate epimerase-like enolase superfamily enzyme